ncbi:MAG: DUF922 domain-containing protein [Rhizobiaceae bacterium]|nr:DUF922 domain-containing protein [Rhizobiaceae bacterium]
MRYAALAAAIALSSGVAGAAEPKGFTVKVDYYEVSGDTPRDLFLAMVKRGPKDGYFRSRAIAQTQYHTEWDTKLIYAKGVCRVSKADPHATITYIYPRQPAGLSRDVERRWKRFMAGIVRHERQHGRYVRDMLAEARKAIIGLKTAGDKDCSRTRAEMKRRVSRIHSKYEAMQREFDVIEHQDGATIDRLIKAFVND